MKICIAEKRKYDWNNDLLNLQDSKCWFCVALNELNKRRNLSNKLTFYIIRFVHNLTKDAR